MNKIGLWTIAILVFFFNACREDESFFAGGTDLTLRADTVYFDTVFTSNQPGKPPSVNKQFTIVNPLKQSVKTSVRLMGGAESNFSINVDGYTGPEVSDLEILPGDSLFVFVEVFVDPNGDPQAMPLIIRDSIEFNTNGNRQFVQLRAWGQDAHYFLEDTICNEVLNDKLKPYVIQGYLYVPENCQLTIKEGVRLHFAPRSWLYVEGTLKIEGTESEPVYFEGDRLQPGYEEEPGQWGGIWMNYLSTDNRIDYARIKNGTVGIYCDSISRNGRPNVIVTNTQVRNMSFDGLSGRQSYIRAENSVFDNCGRYSFLALWGGDYELYHCDFLTYSYRFSRRDPTFVLNNFEANEFGQVIRTFGIDADVRNCIVDGALREEVGFGLIQDSVRSLNFDYNLIRTEQNLDANNLKNRILTEHRDSTFQNYRLYDYHLKPSSKAVNMGFNGLGIPLDFEGDLRDGQPDAGADELR